jgi:hypothetical protein
MFGTIRRHQNWLWVVIITIIVISFVIFFSPDVDFSGRRRAGSLGTLNGRPITQEELNQAYRETLLRYLFSYGTWPSRDELFRQRGINLEQEARFRLALVDKARQLGLRASEKAWAEWVANNPNFRERGGSGFSKQAYDFFMRSVLPQEGLREADFERYVKHELAIRQLNALYGTPGLLVTPREAEAVYREENESFSTELAVFDGADFLSQIQLNATNLSQFYSNRIALYRLPERVEVNYVRFAASNFLAAAAERLAQETNLAARLDAEYQRRGAAFFTDTNGQPLAEAAAKEKMRGELRDQFALVEARKKAVEFANELLDMKPRTADNLTKLAGAKNLKAETTAPFAQGDVPAGLKVPESFSRVAFSLTPEEPFATETLVGEDGVYVLGFKRRIPSEIPPLESILQRVTDDYTQAQARLLAVAAGTNAHARISAGLGQGKAFKKLCEDNKVKVLTLPPFSRASRDLPEAERYVGLFELLNVAPALAPGQISDFNPTRTGGYILHLVARIPAPEDKVKSGVTEYLASLRDLRQSQAFQEWIRVVLEANRMPAGSADTP